MTRPADFSLDSRVASLETAVGSLREDIHTVAASINALRETISQSRQPQWGNLIAAVGLSVVIIGAIGASYVAPIAVNISQHGQLLAERGVTIAGIQDRLRNVESEQVSSIKVIDAELAAIEQRLAEVEANGSGITRERLAVIEAELRRKGP